MTNKTSHIKIGISDKSIKNYIMKLELKHLAPYLPYKLKIRRNSNGTISRLVSLHVIEVFSTLHGRIKYNLAKPILRPLSDLTKEMGHDGKRFIPNHNPMFNIFVQWELDQFISYPRGNCTLSQYEKLVEWHFDVFGLIEKGLAVDINTLSNKKRATV